MKALEGGQKMQEEKGTMLKKILEEELKKDPLTLALISEELSRYGININKEGAKDFVNFNLKVRLISELVVGYIISVVFIMTAVVVAFALIFSVIKDPNFIYRLVTTTRGGVVFLIGAAISLIVVVGGLALLGVILFINARKLHKALCYNKKTNQ